MSSGTAHKMYHYEVPPPDGVWKSIAAELDEIEETRNLSSKLYNTESIPPAAAWAGIASELDASSLVNTLSKRLLDAEVTPPAAAWEKIKAELDNPHEAAIPERRKLSPLLRYAVAASVIGLLAFGAVQLFNNKGTTTGNDGLVKETTTVPEKTNPLSPSPVKEEAVTVPPTPEAIAMADEIRNDAALEASKKTYAKLDKSVSAKMDMAAAFYFNDAIGTGTPRGLGDMFDVPNEQSVTSNNINSRYVMLMTPDGNFIRMSKKLGDLICCVSGEEQDDECVDQLKQWKEKMANAYAGHSPGNFMDILSLVSSLQEVNEL